MAVPTTTSATVPTQRSEWSQLAAALRGDLVVPGDSAYAALATPWNVAVPTAPAAVVAAADADDVATALRFAAVRGLRVAVQCTGHGVACRAGGGPAMAGALLVSTRRLDAVVVSPEGWARVGAGVTWRPVVEAAAPYGLAPLVGSTTGVGVVGYTTGGGLGPLARTFGLASDRVRAFDVVTGDGELRRVTPAEHPDLFWGLRGGRGALGIVTALEFDLVELSTFYGGGLYFAGEDRRAVLQAWRAWAADLPTSCTTSVAVLQLPPLPGVPPPLAGRLTVAVRFAHVGDAAEGERLLAPLRAVAEPVLDGVGVLPFEAVDAVHADPVDPMPAVETSGLFRTLSPEAMDVLAEHAAPGSPFLVLEVRQTGGAFAAESVSSAMDHRDAAGTLLGIGLGVSPGVDAFRVAAGSLHEALSPWLTGGRLPSFTGPGQPYAPATRARLRELAALYDPHRLLLAGDVL